jgi:5-methylcytosine-specific restriction endonuclease McrA
MTAICENGHIREAKAYNFINHRCIECQGRPLKYDYEFCNKVFSDKGFVLLELEYIDCKTMMKYICICGEESETTLDILMHVDIQGCNKCKGIRTSGENHFNWKGGISPEASKIRSSGEYHRWRKDVFKRDNYTCQCCNSIGGSLNAHHIDNFSSNEDKRFNVDNGITLCERCHSMVIKGSFHHVYGTRNNNREQLMEYIINHKEYQAKYDLIT